MRAFNLFNCLKVRKANFQAIRAALLKVFIIKALAISNTKTALIKNEQRYKYKINHPRTRYGTIHRLINVPCVFIKSSVRINFNSLDFFFFKVGFWIQEFYSRIFKLQITTEKMRVRLIIFFNRPIRKQMVNVRQLDLLKLYQHQIVQL